MNLNSKKTQDEKELFHQIEHKDSLEHEFFSMDLCTFLKNTEGDVSEEMNKIQDNIEKIENFTNLLKGSINKFNNLPSTSSIILRQNTSISNRKTRLLDYSKSCSFGVTNFSLDLERKNEEDDELRKKSEEGGGWGDDIDLEKKLSVKNLLLFLFNFFFFFRITFS